MNIQILVISRTIEEFKNYLIEHDLLSAKVSSLSSPFVVTDGKIATTYYECINTDTITSKKFDKIIFISRPKWMINKERTTNTNVIDFIYSNCLNPNTYKYINK